MKRLSWCLVGLLWTQGAVALQVGERVWVALESPFLIDDGYASGVVLALGEERAEVEVRRLEERGERTLYGSCRGGVQVPPAPAATAGSIPYVEQVPLALLSAWRDGQHRFLQREMLGVRFQRWVDQAPGLNPLSLDDAAALAVRYADQGVGDAFEMMALLRRARAPMGFVAPVAARTDELQAVIAPLTELALLHPEALRTAVAQGEPKQLLGRTLALVFARLEADYHALDAGQHADLRAALARALARWASGDGSWAVPGALQLRLPFARG